MHCLVNPVGFWVSDKDSSLVRRPWCLSCCQDLDRDFCDMIPFGAQEPASRPGPCRRVTWSAH